MPRTNSRTDPQSASALAFHVYNRAPKGVSLFRSDADRDRFVDLMSRYFRGPLGEGVSLYAMCLMTTHFHLVIEELKSGGLARLLHRVLAAYAIYYRRRYGGAGPLFDGPYRRKPITDHSQLRWTIGYVHDNHPSGVDHHYSTHRFYDSGDAPSWLAIESGLAPFGGIDGYREYLERRMARQDLSRSLFASRTSY